MFHVKLFGTIGAVKNIHARGAAIVFLASSGGRTGLSIEPAVLLCLPLRERSVMHKGRLEAFTDGVIAIIITIMVLEMKVPHGPDFAALASSAARIPCLCAELHQCCDLLEQPSPHAAGERAGRWPGAVAEHVLAVLAFPGAVRDPLDGRDRFRRAADRGLWICSRDGGDRLSFSGTDADRHQRRGFARWPAPLEAT